MNEIKLTEEQYKAVVEQAEALEIFARKVKEFVEDMRDLGQIDIATCGPGYELRATIKPRELS